MYLASYIHKYRYTCMGMVPAWLMQKNLEWGFAILLALQAVQHLRG